MGVNGMDLRSGAVAHQGHADLLEDARFHAPRVERVAEVVKSHVADTGIRECGSPRAFHDADWLAAILDHQPVGLAALKQNLVQPLGERNFTGFPFGRFRVGHREDLLGEIHVLPSLARDLAAAHAGIECDEDHGSQVSLGHGE